jgi:hypothetical protein
MKRRSRSAAAVKARSVVGVFGNAPPIFKRYDGATATQGFQRHVERQHFRLQLAASHRIFAAAGFALQIAKRAQMFDSRRHETGIFHNAVGNADFFGDQRVVVELERLARTGQVVELAARGGG